MTIGQRYVKTRDGDDACPCVQRCVAHLRTRVHLIHDVGVGVGVGIGVGVDARANERVRERERERERARARAR